MTASGTPLIGVARVVELALKTSANDRYARAHLSNPFETNFFFSSTVRVLEINSRNNRNEPTAILNERIELAIPRDAEGRLINCQPV